MSDPVLASMFKAKLEGGHATLRTDRPTLLALLKGLAGYGAELVDARTLTYADVRWTLEPMSDVCLVHVDTTRTSGG